MRSTSHSPSILRPASQYGDYFFPNKQVDSQNGNNYYETQHASLFGDPVPPPPLSYMENFDNHLYGSLQRSHHKKAASVDNYATKPPKNYPQPPPSASTISHMGPSAFHITTEKLLRSSSRLSLGGGSKIRRKKNRVMNGNSIYDEYQKTSSVITNQSEFQSNLDKFRNANNFSPSPRPSRRFVQVEPEDTSPPFQRFATRSAVDFRSSRRSIEWGEYRPSIDDWGQMVIPRARGRGSAPSNHKHFSNISHSHGFASGSSTSDRNGNSFDDDDYSPPSYRPQRPQLPPPLNVIPYETDTSLPQSPHEMYESGNLMVGEIPRAASPAIIKETVSTGGDHRVESNRSHKKTSFAIINELTPIHSRASSPDLLGRVSPFLGRGFKPPSIFSSRGNSPDNNDKIKPLSVHFTFGASDPPALPFKRDAQGVIDYSYRYHDTDDGIERYEIQRDAVHHKTLISITGKPPLAARPLRREDMKRRSLESLANLRYSDRSFGRRYSFGRLRKASSELQLSKNANATKIQRSKSNLNPTSQEKGLLHIVSHSGSSPSKIPKLKRKSIGRARLGIIPPRIAVSTGSLAPSPQASPMHELRVPETPSHNSRSLTKKKPKRVTLTTGTVVPKSLTGTRSESTSPNRPEGRRSIFSSKRLPSRRNSQKNTLKVPDSDDDSRIPYPRSPQRRGFTTTLSPIIGTPIMGTPMRSFRRTEADRLNEEKEIEKEINRRREERGRQLAIAAKKEAEAAAAAEAALMTGSQYSPSLIPVRNEPSRNNTLTTKMNSRVTSRSNSRAASRANSRMNSRSNSLDKSRGNSVVNSREASPTKEYSSTVNSPTRIPYKTGLKRSNSRFMNSSSSIMEQTTSSIRRTGNSSNRKNSSGDDASNSMKRNDSTRTSLKNSGSFRRDKTENGSVRKEPSSTRKEPGLKREVSNLKKESSNIKRDQPKLKKQPSFIRKEGSSTKKEPSVLRREGSSLSKKSSDSGMSRRLDKKNSFMGTNSSSSIGGGTIKRMLSEMTEEERQSLSYDSSSEMATENPSPEQAEDEGGGGGGGGGGGRGVGGGGGGGGEKFEKLIPLTRNNVVSMTTAAIASQPIQITTTLTNQIPLGKTNSSNHLVANDNSSTKDHPAATTHEHKSLRSIESVQKTVTSATDHFKRAIRDNSHSSDSKHDSSKKIEKRDSSRTLVVSNDNKVSEKNANITSVNANSANANQNTNPSNNNNNNPNTANANIVKNSETTKTTGGVNTERANKDVSSNSSLTNGSSKNGSNMQKQPADATASTKSSAGANVVKSNIPPVAVEASVNVISNNNNNPNTANNNNKVIGHKGALAPINSGDDSDERVSERAISVPPDVELESGNVAKKPAGTATRIPAGRQQLVPNPKPINTSKASVVASDSVTPESAYAATTKNSTATTTSVNTTTAASSEHVDKSTEKSGCCRCCKSPCCGGCCSFSCLPCCSRLFCCCSSKKNTVAGKMSDTSTASRLSMENEKMNKKSTCWGKMRCCGRNMTDLEKAAIEEKKKQEMLTKAAMAMQSNKKRGKCRLCMDKFLCCRATNKVGSPAPSNVDEMHHEDGAEHHDDLTPAKSKCCSCCFPCCRCCRKKKPVPMRRESILSNEPPKKSCCARFWGCCRCCKSKPVVEEESRRTSTSKKQSLAPTIPPEDPRPKLDMSLVEHNSLIKGAIPVLHICLAWFCLLCNILVPGSGTIISGFFCLCFGVPRFSQHDGARPRIGSFVINWIIGVSQAFCLLFCLVGWGWSVWWGIIMLQTSKKHKKVLEMEALGSHQSNVGGFRPATQPPVVAQNHRDVEAARA